MTGSPSLRILTGVEIGEPHWFPAEVDGLARSGRFERVLGSLHSVDDRGLVHAPSTSGSTPPDIDGEAEAPAVRDYLAEATAMIEPSGSFEVLAHIDYLVRQIVNSDRSHDPRQFEAEYRETLRALALRARPGDQHAPAVGPAASCAGGTRSADRRSPSVPTPTPRRGGLGFAEAHGLAEASGFRPGRDRFDFWRR